MKKLLTTLLVFGLCTTAWAAWDKTKPTNSQKLLDSPALIRANWDAIELGTDAALQITNAKVAAAAGIVDTKLATISTAGKVSGAAITSISSVPAGAGALPVANGGTAATSASAARTSLGAAASGANSDITSITGLSTPLAVAQGGTGSATLNNVQLTGNQTVAGTKTFSTAIATGSGGTGSTANANAANGVVVLNASSQLPAVSGALLTNLPVVGISSILDYGSSSSSSTSKNESDLHICYGKISIGGNEASVAVTNLPFTSASTYSVIVTSSASDMSYVVDPVIINNDSGSQFTAKMGQLNHTRYLMWIAIGT